MTKHILLSLSILSLALLQACGGGDSNDGKATVYIKDATRQSVQEMAAGLLTPADGTASSGTGSRSRPVVTCAPRVVRHTSRQ